MEGKGDVFRFLRGLLIRGADEMVVGVKHCEHPLAWFHSQPQMATISRGKGREGYDKGTEGGRRAGREPCACVPAGLKKEKREK